MSGCSTQSLLSLSKVFSPLACVGVPVVSYMLLSAAGLTMKEVIEDLEWPSAGSAQHVQKGGVTFHLWDRPPQLVLAASGDPGSLEVRRDELCDVLCRCSHLHHPWLMPRVDL